MSYDLLISTFGGNKWYAYEGLDTYSQALYLAKKETKNHLSFVYVRRVSSSGADVWKYFFLNTRTYKKLHYVDSSKNTYLLSKFDLSKVK